MLKKNGRNDAEKMMLMENIWGERCVLSRPVRFRSLPITRARAHTLTWWRELHLGPPWCNYLLPTFTILCQVTPFCKVIFNIRMISLVTKKALIPKRQD